MTLRKRRLLFYFLILVFILLGTTVVFYAQGWRLTWPTLGVTKVGGIYVRSWPADTDIYLSDQRINRPFSFFETGLLISDLFPKQYDIRLERTGFAPWRRSVIVRPSLVSEIKHAILIPQDATPIGTSTATAIWPIGPNLLFRTPSGTLLWQNMVIPGESVIGWTDDGNRLLTVQAGRYFWTDLTTGSSTDLAARFRTRGLVLPREAAFIVTPHNSSELLVRSPRTLALYDLEEGVLTPFASTTATTTWSAVASYRNLIAWSLFSADANRSDIVVIDRNRPTETYRTTLAGKTTRLAWAPNGSRLGILQDTGALVLYEAENDTFASRASDVRDFIFDKNATHLASLEQHSLEIFSFKTDDYWRFNVPDIEAVRHAHWHKDGFHLFLQYPDRLALLDLEDLNLENIQTVVPGTENAYDERTNTLFFVRNERPEALAFPE